MTGDQQASRGVRLGVALWALWTTWGVALALVAFGAPDWMAVIAEGVRAVADMATGVSVAVLLVSDSCREVSDG